MGFDCGFSKEKAGFGLLFLCCRKIANSYTFGFLRLRIKAICAPFISRFSTENMLSPPQPLVPRLGYSEEFRRISPYLKGI